MTSTDLQKFCDPTRHTLATPFSQEVWSFAGCGAMVLRVMRLPDVPERTDAPRHLRELFEKNPCTERFMDLKGIALPPLSGPEPCPVCDGSTIHFCQDCGESHPCRNCNETGRVPETAVPVEIGKHLVSHLLLHRIKDLPNVAIAEHTSDPRGPLTFTFTGGDGLLCPMKKPDNN